jgi:hypothetical protein
MLNKCLEAFVAVWVTSRVQGASFSDIVRLPLEWHKAFWSLMIVIAAVLQVMGKAHVRMNEWVTRLAMQATVHCGDPDRGDPK